MASLSSRGAAAAQVLLVEPFYGGSHKQFIDFLEQLLSEANRPYFLATFPGKKWHWRARTSALYMSRTIPLIDNLKVILCSSVLNLAELVALRPDLSSALKIIYFHENQFTYPRQKQQQRDFQYGYNTILSALVADRVIFNSHFNMTSFLENISHHLNQQPDNRVRCNFDEEIRPKCSVIYFPIAHRSRQTSRDYSVLHIVWPHRWEHDKDPQLFFETLFRLKDEQLNFSLSVLGESFDDPMPIFQQARVRLEENIKHFGRIKDRDEYVRTLESAHVVVSTAKHEFFGVAMAEAVKCGCYPIAPAALVYPELYPPQCLYKTPQQLFKKLRDLCKRPNLVLQHMPQVELVFNKTDIDSIKASFRSLLIINDSV